MQDAQLKVISDDDDDVADVSQLLTLACCCLKVDLRVARRQQAVSAGKRYGQREVKITPIL